MPKSPQLLSHTGQGSQSVKIDHDDFTKGASTSDTFGDAGFSPDSYNINLTKNIGEITPTAVAVSKYQNYSYIASCPNDDVGGTSGFAVRLLNITGLFSSITTAGVQTIGATDSTNTYAVPWSDMVAFNGNYYASSHNAVTGDNVCKWNGVSTLTVDWFHTNFSKYLKLNAPHPMLVFNKCLYIADGNLLHKYSEPGGTPTYTADVLTLDTDAVITALSIDPNSGRMMVAYGQVWANYQSPTKPNIGLYDGTNPTQFVKLVPMDVYVNTMFSVGGIVYVGYGRNLGIWNGSGVSFLRKLSSTSLLTKQNITNIGNDIFFVDVGTIWGYTEMQGGGKKVFYKLYVNPTYSVPVLFNQDGQSILGFSFTGAASVGQFYNIDTAAAGDYTQTAVLKSNTFHLLRPCYVRAVDVIMGGLLTTNETITPVIIDDNGVSNPSDPTTLTYANTTRVNRFNFGGIPTTEFQLQLTMNTSAPLSRAIIYYDFSE